MQTIYFMKQQIPNCIIYYFYYYFTILIVEYYKKMEFIFSFPQHTPIAILLIQWNFRFLCLPGSISRECELIRMLLNTFLKLKSFIRNK